MTPIGVGLLGLGVVGTGVATTLLQKRESIAEQLGCSLDIRRILVRSPRKKRSPQIDRRFISTEFNQVADDPDIQIVVEVMGGEYPAVEYIRKLLSCGKYVVTANKEVMAKHGAELVSLAEDHGVEIFYEASVGGGIPLIAPLKHALVANKISTLHGIINGTTNYILTRMSKEGIEFAPALQLAQELGYAEADPANDIEGVDASYKLAILATLAFRTAVRPRDVYYEGITHLSDRDFRYARELGYAIKLLAIAKENGNSIEVRVHPVLLAESVLLAKVDGVYNAVQIEGDMVGPVLFHGQGAGALPTSSAVVADVIAAAQNLRSGARNSVCMDQLRARTVASISEIQTRYYVRMSIVDQPGVLAQIAKSLGDNAISISSVIQEEADTVTRTAEIVIMTHPAREQAMQDAIREIKELPVVKEVGSFIRVED